MKRLTILFTLIPFFAISQQTYVPDDNFEAYLEANGMCNGIANDDYVTTSNISGVTNLSVFLQNITNLTGIEDFAALTWLDCGSNQLTSLDVNNNTALTVFYCNNNQLTSLDVSNNTALTWLKCDDNQLTSLDVSNNTALNDLKCNNNQLTSLDVSNNTALTYMRCYENQLTSLDVSNNFDLTNLECNNNQLTSLDVSNNTALIELWCNNNQLTCLNVKNGNNMNMFVAENNPNLTCIEVDDPTWSTANWTVINSNIDAGVTFNTNCNYPTGCFATNITENTNSINFYPNPTNDLITINIEGNNKPFNVEVYDFTGRLLQTTNNTTISLKDYPKGIYMLNVAYGDKVEQVKVVRE